MDNNWETYAGLPVSNSDLNQDMFRDYDYRSTGRALKPEIVFRFGLTWAKMALDKAQAAGINDNKKVLIAKDARKIEPQLIEALVCAIMYAGLDVIYIAGNGPNCVTSYSWAVQEFKPLMSIFVTASHVSRPKDETVRGFKVAMVARPGGNLESLSTREINIVSKKAIEALINDPGSIRDIEAAGKGKYTEANVDDYCIRMNTLLGRIIAKGKGLSLYNFARELESAADPVKVLKNWEEVSGTDKTLAGIRAVIDAAHTPSGKLACDTFKHLGCDAILINGDVREIEGEHKADPSRDENLIELKDKIKTENADFGMAFDLDGDRGAIVLPLKSAGSNDMSFETLPPDNLMVAIIKYIIDNCGYSQKETDKRAAVIRDVLGTYGLNDMASRLGVEVYQTDAGYVNLKAKRQELKQLGYVVPIYGERSGHCWLDAAGEFENPLAVAVLFITMVAADKPFIEAFNKRTMPYKQSSRFQPLFAPKFLEQISDDKRNKTNWSYDVKTKTNPPQVIIALGRNIAIERLKAEFIVGKSYKCPAGALTVAQFNEARDPRQEGGYYRFADIVFNEGSKFAGRFIFRASSNDPTFVCTYEAKVYGNESLLCASVNNRFISIAGLVLDWLEKNGIALVTGDITYPNKPQIQKVVQQFRIAMTKT